MDFKRIAAHLLEQPGGFVFELRAHSIHTRAVVDLFGHFGPGSPNRIEGVRLALYGDHRGEHFDDEPIFEGAATSRSSSDIAVGLEGMVVEVKEKLSALSLCDVCKKYKEHVYDGACVPCAFATAFFKTRTETTHTDAEGVETTTVEWSDAADIDDCSICLSKLYPVADALFETPCKHTFHRRCYSAHVTQRRQQGRDGECPLCRAPSEEGGEENGDE